MFKFFAILIILSSSVLVHAAEFEIKVPHAPQAQRQYSTPWCYAMSVRFVLEQAMCQSRAGCSPGIAISSILALQSQDSIIGGSNGSLFTGGDQGKVLKALEKTGVVKQKSCTQENLLWSLQKYRNDDYKGLGLEVQLGILFQSFEILKSQNQLRPPTKDDLGVILKTQISSTIPKDKFNDLVELLLAKMAAASNEEQFIRSLVLGDECKGQQIKLPRFVTHSSDYIDERATNKLLLTNLKARRAVSVSVCSGTLEEQKQNGCGPHAITVIGVRSKCSGTCSLSYLILDSSRFPKSAPNPDGSYWISAQLLNQSLKDYSKQLSKSLENLRSVVKQGIVDCQRLQAESLAELALAHRKIMDVLNEGLKDVDAYYAATPSDRYKFVSGNLFAGLFSIEIIKSEKDTVDWITIDPNTNSIKLTPLGEHALESERSKIAERKSAKLNELDKVMEDNMKTLQQYFRDGLEKIKEYGSSDYIGSLSTDSFVWIELVN